MKTVLKTPELVAEARGEKNGWNWAVELLAFVGVFFVSTFAMVLIMAPGELVMLAQNAAYQEALAAGDVNAALEAAAQIGTSDAYMVLSLFADIMMIGVALLFCKLIQKRRMRTLGFTKDGVLKEYLIGAGVGFLIFSVAVLLCVVTGALRLEGISDTFSVGMFVLFLLGFMVQGMAEEVLCRGYFIRKGNIWGIGALHSVWNLVQGNFYGIKVSGMATSCTVFSSTAVEGREIINGGAFGLEGGLAVTIVLTAGILMLCFVKGKKTEDMQD